MARMDWARPGAESLVQEVRRRLAAAPWPAAPEGFVPLGRLRPMRAVYEGTLDGHGGPVRVVLKRHQADRLVQRWLRVARGGRGPREGRVLRALEQAGIPVPTVLGWSDEGEDFLLTQYLEPLRPLPAGDQLSRADLGSLATLLSQAHRRGLRHRDWHARNLALGPEGAVLLDLGGARLGRALSEPQRIEALARLDHGLFGAARRAQRLRALAVYTHVIHPGDARRARAALRAWAGPIERRSRAVARAYRRGRDRRALRSGPHFDRFVTREGGSAARYRDQTDEGWRAALESWVAPASAGARELSRRVERRLAPDGRDVVLKRFPPTGRGRRPYARAAFAMAHALRNRWIPVPLALGYASSPTRGSVLVSESLPHLDLDAFVRGGAMGQVGTPGWRALLNCLGRTLRAMHEADVTHRDLKAPNLVVKADPVRPRVWLVDLDGARIRRASPTWPRRARDLGRLDHSLAATRTDRLRVLLAYLGGLPRPPVDTRTFLAWIQASRTAVRQRHAARYGPDSGPR